MASQSSKSRGTLGSFTLARIITSSSGSSRDLCPTNLRYFTHCSQRRGRSLPSSLPDIPGLLLVDILGRFFSPPEIQQVFMGDARRNYPRLLRLLFPRFQRRQLSWKTVYVDDLTRRSFEQLFSMLNFGLRFKEGFDRR